MQSFFVTEKRFFLNTRRKHYIFIYKNINVCTDVSGEHLITYFGTT